MTLALWTVAALLGAVLIAALFLRSGPRDDVSEYVQQVNEVERSFATSRHQPCDCVFEV